ncbi:Glutaminyl-peptide cyclotransferase [Acorus gramineus]|uniref:Glutaminyl-peptide cyclotransferase n=1 Tax=Acorus gramineus TaxID=55184 RepID=A0AAV9ADX1_ACOGR|nr:Glutaminyl-peptide cyclotransferase [Acorus gramineus]
MTFGSLKKKSKRSPTSSSSQNFPKTSPPPHPRFSRRRLAVAFFVASLCVVVVVRFAFERVPPSSEIYTIEVVNEFPHDPTAFTQGLVYAGNDTLFESTGLYGQSSVRQVHLQTGKVILQHKMDDSKFGEGLTLLDGRLIQVTWLERIGFIYDQYNLSKLKSFTHQMQDGWGLATDGKVLYGSDGTSTLYQIDPMTLKVVGKDVVRYKDHEVSFLNELEYVNGEVLANVWQTDCIARISQKDGMVLGWILLHELR